MFNIRSVRQAFFKSAERKAVVIPESLSARAADDEIYEARKKLTLRFVLPRGSYGSILIKRLFIGQGSVIERGQEVKT
jgi:tRNA pseudouridine13 synthase